MPTCQVEWHLERDLMLLGRPIAEAKRKRPVEKERLQKQLDQIKKSWAFFRY